MFQSEQSNNLSRVKEIKWELWLDNFTITIYTYLFCNVSVSTEACESFNLCVFFCFCVALVTGTVRNLCLLYSYISLVSENVDPKPVVSQSLTEFSPY